MIKPSKFKNIIGCLSVFCSLSSAEVAIAEDQTLIVSNEVLSTAVSRADISALEAGDTIVSGDVNYEINNGIGITQSIDVAQYIEQLTTPETQIDIARVTNYTVSTDIDLAPIRRRYITRREDRADFALSEESSLGISQLLVSNMDSEMQVADVSNSALGAGIAAGEVAKEDAEELKQYGAWIGGFDQVAIQKPCYDAPGYKLQSHGFMVGADTRLSEDSIAGFAFTKTDSIMKRKDALNPSKATLDTNILSIYGTTVTPNNFMVKGTLSYGKSTIKDKSDAYNAKYKSQYIGVDVRAFKMMSLNYNPLFIIEPTMGLTYSKFVDNSYTRYLSTGLQTHIDGRSSYNLEGILGGRANYSYEGENWTLIPEASAFAHIRIKDYKGAIHRSLDSNTAIDSNAALLLRPSKVSNVWYSGGLGLSAKKGSLEFGLAWEMQKDRRYISNQGTLKIKLGF